MAEGPRPGCVGRRIVSSAGAPVDVTRVQVPNLVNCAGWLVEAEVLAELGHVAGGLDVVLRLLHRAGLVDDERRPDHAGDSLAIELLLAVRTVGLEHGPVRVAEQRKG